VAQAKVGRRGLGLWGRRQDEGRQRACRDGARRGTLSGPRTPRWCRPRWGAWRSEKRASLCRQRRCHRRRHRSRSSSRSSSGGSSSSSSSSSSPLAACAASPPPMAFSDAPRTGRPPPSTSPPQEGIPEEYDVVYVGCTPTEVDVMEQEVGGRRVGPWVARASARACGRGAPGARVARFWSRAARGRAAPQPRTPAFQPPPPTLRRPGRRRWRRRCGSCGARPCSSRPTCGRSTTRVRLLGLEGAGRGLAWGDAGAGPCPPHQQNAASIKIRPPRLLQAAAVAAVPLHSADEPRQRRALPARTVAGLRQGKQGADSQSARPDRSCTCAIRAGRAPATSPAPNRPRRCASPPARRRQAFAETVVEACATDADTVWIHDYHLLVLPSLLRKRFNKIRCGAGSSPSCTPVFLAAQHAPAPRFRPADSVNPCSPAAPSLSCLPPAAACSCTAPSPPARSSGRSRSARSCCAACSTPTSLVRAHGGGTLALAGFATPPASSSPAYVHRVDKRSPRAPHS
jgi:hypothetical protein